MKRKIKILAAGIVAVVMTCTNIPLNGGNQYNGVVKVFAQDNSEELSYRVGNQNYIYCVKEDGTAEITDCFYGDDEIVIPDKIWGISVTSIGAEAFSSCKMLKKIVIPSSVTSIGEKAFMYCSSLTEITIPSSVTSIGDYAFNDCESLTEITIPSSVTSIGVDVFSQCYSLKKITIPSSVTSIEFGAFRYSSLTEITIPSSVTSIGDYAFNGCESLKKITIPSSVTSIGGYAFSGCSSLTEITIPSSVTSTGKYAFSGCENLEKVTISNGVTRIDYMTFANCKSLKEITLPDSLIEIGGFAFWQSGLTDISLPKNLKSIDYEAFCYCDSLKEIAISESVESIGLGAFDYCGNLENVYVAEGNIHYRSVNGVLYNKDCSELLYYPAQRKEVIIPDSVVNIGRGACCGISSVEKIIIPKSVVLIGMESFKNCSNLKEIIIPESITEIGAQAFYHCNKLKSIYLLCDSVVGNDMLGDLHYYNPFDSYTIYYNPNNGDWSSLISEYDKYNWIKINADNDVIVQYAEEEVLDDISLSATLIDETSDAHEKIVGILHSSDIRFEAYDITLTNGEGDIVQPEYEVTVKIPVPQDYDGEECNVYRVESDDSLTDMEAEFDGEELVFNTDHFSTYIITEEQLLSNPNYIYGDLNGDGIVDIKDSAVLKRYLVGWDVEIDEQMADLNGDGEVDIKDSALLKRYLVGWNVKFVE